MDQEVTVLGGVFVEERVRHQLEDMAVHYDANCTYALFDLVTAFARDNAHATDAFETGQVLHPVELERLKDLTGNLELRAASVDDSWVRSLVLHQGLLVVGQAFARQGPSAKGVLEVLKRQQTLRASDDLRRIHLSKVGVRRRLRALLGD